ncbi:MAG TPA: ATP-grasp domain-containing protein [Elainellaceae cyanobacterium]
MDLLEYQAKELFRQYGIPVLPSQQIENLQDLKNLEIPYPIVLKSQVRVGGRAKAGGIRFVENTIDAIAAAQALFKLPISGDCPQVLLAEAKYNPEQELYLAIVIDTKARRPVLLGSVEGGVGIDLAIDHIQKVVVEQEFTSFYARKLALKMGLSGSVFQSVSRLIEQMCRLFITKDLDLIEINPLAINPSGDVMALDGKVTVNEVALGRHDDLAQLKPRVTPSSESLRRSHSLPSLEPVLLGGDIGIMCNGAGLTMTILDMVCQAGGKPAHVLNIGGECRYLGSSAMLVERIEHGLSILTQRPDIRVILVNIFSNGVPCSQIAATIARHIRLNTQEPVPRLVVRLVGQQLDQARDILSAADLPLVDQLDTAVDQVITISHPERAKSSA